MTDDIEGRAIFDRKVAKESISVRGSIRIRKAVYDAYGEDAPFVLLVPRTRMEWLKAASASAHLHDRGPDVHLSVTGINPPVLTTTAGMR